MRAGREQRRTRGRAVAIPAELTPRPVADQQVKTVIYVAVLGDLPDISDYNTFVTTEAAQNAALAAFDTANGVTWTVIGSSGAVDADVNSPSTGLVYTLDGAEVASIGVYGVNAANPDGSKS